MRFFFFFGNRGFPATVVNRLFPRSPRHSTYSWDLTLARVTNASRTCGERILMRFSKIISKLHFNSIKHILYTPNNIIKPI